MADMERVGEVRKRPAQLEDSPQPKAKRRKKSPQTNTTKTTATTKTAATKAGSKKAPKEKAAAAEPPKEKAKKATTRTTKRSPGTKENQKQLSLTSWVKTKDTTSSSSSGFVARAPLRPLSEFQTQLQAQLISDLKELQKQGIDPFQSGPPSLSIPSQTSTSPRSSSSSFSSSTTDSPSLALQQVVQDAQMKSPEQPSSDQSPKPRKSPQEKTPSRAAPSKVTSPSHLGHSSSFKELKTESLLERIEKGNSRIVQTETQITKAEFDVWIEMILHPSTASATEKALQSLNKEKMSHIFFLVSSIDREKLLPLLEKTHRLSRLHLYTALCQIALFVIKHLSRAQLTWVLSHLAITKITGETTDERQAALVWLLKSVSQLKVWETEIQNLPLDQWLKPSKEPLVKNLTPFLVALQIGSSYSSGPSGKILKSLFATNSDLILRQFVCLLTTLSGQMQEEVFHLLCEVDDESGHFSSTHCCYIDTLNRVINDEKFRIQRISEDKLIGASKTVDQSSLDLYYSLTDLQSKLLSYSFEFQLLRPLNKLLITNYFGSDHDCSSSPSCSPIQIPSFTSSKDDTTPSPTSSSSTPTSSPLSQPKFEPEIVYNTIKCFVIAKMFHGTHKHLDHSFFSQFPVQFSRHPLCSAFLLIFLDNAVPSSLQFSYEKLFELLGYMSPVESRSSLPSLSLSSTDDPASKEKEPMGKTVSALTQPAATVVAVIVACFQKQHPTEIERLLADRFELFESFLLTIGKMASSIAMEDQEERFRESQTVSPIFSDSSQIFVHSIFRTVGGEFVQMKSDEKTSKPKRGMASNPWAFLPQIVAICQFRVGIQLMLSVSMRSFGLDLNRMPSCTTLDAFLSHSPTPISPLVKLWISSWTRPSPDPSSSFGPGLVLCILLFLSRPFLQTEVLLPSTETSTRTEAEDEEDGDETKQNLRQDRLILLDTLSQNTFGEMLRVIASSSLIFFKGTGESVFDDVIDKILSCTSLFVTSLCAMSPIMMTASTSAMFIIKSTSWSTLQIFSTTLSSSTSTNLPFPTSFFNDPISNGSTLSRSMSRSMSRTQMARFSPLLSRIAMLWALLFQLPLTLPLLSFTTFSETPQKPISSSSQAFSQSQLPMASQMWTQMAMCEEQLASKENKLVDGKQCFSLQDIDSMDAVDSVLAMAIELIRSESERNRTKEVDGEVEERAKEMVADFVISCLFESEKSLGLGTDRKEILSFPIIEKGGAEMTFRLLRLIGKDLWTFLDLLLRFIMSLPLCRPRLLDSLSILISHSSELRLPLSSSSSSSSFISISFLHFLHVFRPPSRTPSQTHLTGRKIMVFEDRDNDDEKVFTKILKIINHLLDFPSFSESILQLQEPFKTSLFAFLVSLSDPQAGDQKTSENISLLLSNIIDKLLLSHSNSFPDWWPLCAPGLSSWIRFVFGDSPSSSSLQDQADNSRSMQIQTTSSSSTRSPNHESARFCIEAVSKMTQTLMSFQRKNGQIKTPKEFINSGTELLKSCYLHPNIFKSPSERLTMAFMLPIIQFLITFQDRSKKTKDPNAKLPTLHKTSFLILAQMLVTSVSTSSPSGADQQCGGSSPISMRKIDKIVVLLSSLLKRSSSIYSQTSLSSVVSPMAKKISPAAPRLRSLVSSSSAPSSLSTGLDVLFHILKI